MVSQQIGLGTFMFGFGQLSWVSGRDNLHFCRFLPWKAFSPFLWSLSLSLPVPISLLSFASVPLCLFVPAIASANLLLKPIPGLFQKWSTKHEFYMPCTQSSVNTFTDHCGCTHPITDIPFLTGLDTRDPAWPRVHIIGSRNAEKTSTILCLDEYLSARDLNPDEMHQIKEITTTAWCFIDHKPFLELWVFAENIYFWQKWERRVWWGQQWVWQRRWSS